MLMSASAYYAYDIAIMLKILYHCQPLLSSIYTGLFANKHIAFSHKIYPASARKATGEKALPHAVSVLMPQLYQASYQHILKAMQTSDLLKAHTILLNIAYIIHATAHMNIAAGGL